MKNDRENLPPIRIYIHVASQHPSVEGLSVERERVVVLLPGAPGLVELVVGGSTPVQPRQLGRRWRWRG